MPKRHAARGKHRRAPVTESLFDLSDAMETPLHRLEDLVRALEYIGFGLASLGEDGAPAVLGLAQALSENLQAVKRPWRKLLTFQAAGSP